MIIGKFKEYKGYIGTIEYDPEDKIYYGKLDDIDDFVNYHAVDVVYFEIQFHDAVDDYIEFKRTIGR